MQGNWGTSEKLLQLVKELVAVPSIVGSYGEKEMGEKICSLLEQVDYFKDHPTNIYQIPISNDNWDRFSVAAIYEGNPNDKRAYVLLSHFDVVGIDDFGQYKPLAFRADDYTDQMKTLEVSVDVANDIKTGEWLFGRGVMDMKAGLAVQMQVLADAIATNQPMNLILLATPDEERNSEGMLASVEWLANWKEENEYEELIGICSEPTFTSYPGDPAKYIYTGSVGKMLPLVCAVGRETHVGEPLAGVNASWMISEVVTEMELSERFYEERDGDIVPPPTALRLSDLKYEYNVQTPTFAYATFNILTYTKDANDVLEEIKKVVLACSSEVEGRMLSRYETYKVKEKVPTVSVFTYGELRAKGEELYGAPFTEQLEAVTERVYNSGGDTRDVTIALAKEVGDYFTGLTPFYLIMFAPPYYPAVRLRKDVPLEATLLFEMTKLQEWTELELGEKITQKQYFPGLSDVSYGKVEETEKVKRTLEKEMPTLDQGYRLPLEAMKKLNMPTVNIGPFGKDAHKRTERLHLPFFTQITPLMLKRFLQQMNNN